MNTDNKREKNDFFSDKYLNINSCGNYYNKNYKIFRKDGRSDYQLLYIKSGKCSVVYNGREYLLSNGSFVVYYPGQTQEYSFDKAGCRTLWIHFSGKAASEILAELDIESGVYEGRLSENAVVIFEELIREFCLKNYMHQSAENALMIYLLTMVSRHIRTERNTTDIEKVMVLMNMSIDMPYDAQRFADICSLSKSRFSHKFKETAGVVPTEYFIRIKLEKAKELLAFSDLTVAETARSVGYDNALYFSRLFKKHTKLSPTQYRKKTQNNNLQTERLNGNGTV